MFDNIINKRITSDRGYGVFYFETLKELDKFYSFFKNEIEDYDSKYSTELDLAYLPNLDFLKTLLYLYNGEIVHHSYLYSWTPDISWLETEMKH